MCSVTLIYLFKKAYFIADLRRIFQYFLYATSLKFYCTRKPAYNKQN